MTSAISRKMLGLLGASVAVLSLPVLAAAPSSAATGSTVSAASDIGINDVGVKGRPSGCDYAPVHDYGSLAWCDDDNGGSWRAIAVCKVPGSGKILYGYGQWSQGPVSQAFCNGTSKVKSAGIETTTKDMT